MRLKVQRVRSRSSSDSARSRHNRREQARTGGCIAQVRRDQSDTPRHSIVTKTLLATCELNGIELRNCPAYIREWVTKERESR
jgi:hypothetical protein